MAILEDIKKELFPEVLELLDRVRAGELGETQETITTIKVIVKRLNWETEYRDVMVGYWIGYTDALLDYKEYKTSGKRSAYTKK